MLLLKCFFFWISPFQIDRWFKQYLASTSEGKPERNPKMFELVDWLRKNIPAEDSTGATSGLVHGDFRIDNLVFHPSEVWILSRSFVFWSLNTLGDLAKKFLKLQDRVIGIIDWELSTLGNQMCDVAYSCMVISYFCLLYCTHKVVFFASCSDIQFMVFAALHCACSAR